MYKICVRPNYLMILRIFNFDNASQAILRRWNFDCRLYDHWSLIGNVYMKILPDDPECFDNASNLEEMEFWYQNTWSLIIDQSCVPEDLIWWSWVFWQCDQSWGVGILIADFMITVPEDLTWWSWVFWQCEQSWGGGILIADYMITDHWSVMYFWRSYLMILSVLTMRAILRRRKYWAVRLTSPTGYFPSIQLNKRIIPVWFVLTDFSCI